MAGLFPLTAKRAPLPPGSYTQSQFAATIAAALGLDPAFRAAHPGAAPPIEFCCKP